MTLEPVMAIPLPPRGSTPSGSPHVMVLAGNG